MAERVGDGSAPINPHAKELYKQEYQHGADLFQRALKEHANSQNIYQKAEFKDVMDKALLVLNETARELKEKNLLAQNQQIENDYKAYQSSPNQKTMERLEEDLQRAKGSFVYKEEPKNPEK